ncbi:MAG: helix-turn-helix transcriptional regulator [Desulfobacterales bacterium]|nr:helix-turn-helix transcriptional regulator [Desulfobacterales bacterium]
MTRSKKTAEHDVRVDQPGPQQENRAEPPITQQNDLLFRTLKQIADALVSTFPRAFEVVVHDLSHPQKSIKHIAGDVTRRKSGGPVTDLVVKALHQEGRDIRDRHNYKTTTSDGRALKSTTTFIRNSNGDVAFALCINFDMTDFLNAAHALEILTSAAGAFNGHEKAETFAMTITETFEALFSQAVAKIGKEPASMSMEEKIELVKELETLGVFHIKGGTDQAALLMGVSKYTIYNYLKKIHAEQGLNRF